MLFHGSKTGNIKILKPSISSHDESYVYLTTNRSVALVYTVNAIERFFESKGYKKPDYFHAWYSYGFNKDRLPRFEEYYPNAIKETYSGKSGYIYTCKEPIECSNPTNIYCAYVSKEEVEVINEEFIEDIYEEILKLESSGLVEILHYKDLSVMYKNRIEQYILEDIKENDLTNKPNDSYTLFLKEKFPHLF